MTRPKLLQMQVIAIHKIMELHCVKGADGMATYADGWNDERVMNEVAAVNPLPDRPITIVQVKGLRLQVFGKVRMQAPPKNDARFKALEDQVVQLMQRVNDIERWARPKGYTPPPGKVVSSPPDTSMREHH